MHSDCWFLAMQHVAMVRRYLPHAGINNEIPESRLREAPVTWKELDETVPAPFGAWCAVYNAFDRKVKATENPAIAARFVGRDFETTKGDISYRVLLRNPTRLLRRSCKFVRFDLGVDHYTTTGIMQNLTADELVQMSPIFPTPPIDQPARQPTYLTTSTRQNMCDDQHGNSDHVGTGGVQPTEDELLMLELLRPRPTDSSQSKPVAVKDGSKRRALINLRGNSVHLIPNKSDTASENNPELYEEDEFTFTTTKGGHHLPKTIKEALTSENADMWREAIERELTGLEEKGTWSWVRLEEAEKRSGKILSTKMVLDLKLNQDNSILKYKARLCLRGFEQTPGIEFDENIFSPAPRSSSVRLLLALAAQNDWTLTSYDIVQAFISSEIEDDVTIFCRLPPEYRRVDEDGQELVCKLNKALYGSRQAPRLFNKKLSNCLKNLGWRQLENEPCLFVHNTTEAYLIHHVDDLLLALPEENEGFRDHFYKELSSTFQVTGNQTVEVFLSMRIRRTHDGIYLSQKKLCEDIGRIYGFDDEPCRHTTTLFPQGFKTEVTEDHVMSPEFRETPEGKEIVHEYRKIVGKISYLANITRPDLAIAVHSLSKVLDKPGEVHLKALKHLVQYIWTTKGLNLYYHKMPAETQNKLLVYSDASNSTQILGYCTTLNGSAISWRSFKSKHFCQGSQEAEILAANEATRHCLSLRYILDELGFTQGPTPLFVDSEPAISILRNFKLTEATSHIDRRKMVTPHQYNIGNVNPAHMRSENNLSDLQTKHPTKKVTAQLITQFMKPFPEDTNYLNPFA
jgi:hypothetical protein